MPDGTFLAVQTPAGPRYTRAGALSVRPDGTLEAAGHPVLSDSQSPVVVADPATAAVLADGRVATKEGPGGRLGLFRFSTPSELIPEGSSLLRATPEAGEPAASTDAVTPGALEESSASAVAAMTDLMSTTRTFEAMTKAINAFYEADRKAGAIHGA
jgi:flagellar basal-body rod protein FlgF